MISGIVPFEEIVQAVKDETGIENIRPFYEKIRRLMFRGEREIGYGGSVELAKKTYLVAGIESSDCNFGKYFKFPEDFIEYEGIGQDCKIVTSNRYRTTPEGIRFKEKQTKDTVLLYWAIKVDDQGFPMVTRNHEEAVIAYIVWKLYSSKIFLGIGNMNANKNYEDAFTMALLEARGDDAFPTLEQWNALGNLMYTDRRLLIDQPVHSYDYCAEYKDIICEDSGVEPNPNTISVNYWQLENSADGIDEVAPLINQSYLLTKPLLNLTSFENGVTVEYTEIGRIVFALSQVNYNLNYKFRDALGNDVTSIFDQIYFPDTFIKLYVSKLVFAPSNIPFKIQAP
jgi:hypothetical protein